MNTTTYNGWTNYETWNYKLWLDNDEGTYLYWQEQVAEILRETEAADYLTKAENCVYTLSEQLKAECDEQLDAWMGDQASCFTDLLNGAVSAINWHEIATSLIESVEEQAA